MTILDCVSSLSDQALLEQVKTAAHRERTATARLIALLAEVDHRRLYLGEGCASLFTYCTQVLHLSEHAAYGRIAAARAVRRYPVVLDLLTEGAITLTTVTLLAPHLTAGNYAAVLQAAQHRSKRDVERLVAVLQPQPDVPSRVSAVAVAAKSPTERPAAIDESSEARPTSLLLEAEGTAHSESRHVEAVAAITLEAAPARPSPRPIVTPLSPQRYKIQCTVSAATRGTLSRIQDLLRHTIPDGDLGAILDRALTLLLADLERAKCATTERPGARKAITSSRHIPAAVRRAVWQRDGGQCAFVGATGRCTERGFVEFHHAEPYAVGGLATVENIALRCRAHNLHEAEQYFGDRLPLLARESRPGYTWELGPDRVWGSAAWGSAAGS